ncbi:phospholipid-binding protein, PBP family [Salinimicrobium catena]|uniref:Phospholipid-binding protein, PBP family n=1 Tax=Salinimicrobium catena TaxID=390640 RepID=A0A1H5M1P9_9FLAO|nr:YbhB/YbcL family Raf kinase inhibitor-like protein [Salinimicrobium catena]SDL17520.1 phospholipid-binding protein, PBP family [Salinimicrobium catena]SEE83275.1 phospholipid-binding protein, PBP family [Salinimicrobium catena]
MVATINLSSKVFSAGDEIPSRYTCDGEDVNPPLTIGKLPDKTQSLTLIVEDPDAPMGTWDHWLVWNIPPAGEIQEDSIPGTEGKNSFHKHHYGGPCPPSGTHRYFFKIYALDSRLDLGADTEKEALEKAMTGKILGRGEIMCLYSKK